MKKVLHQLRRRTRDYHLRSLARPLNAQQHDAHALADSKRFEARLLFLPHSRFGLADIENDFRAFKALDRRVDDFAYSWLIFVEYRVTLGFTNFLKDDLLGKLCGDAAENCFTPTGAPYPCSHRPIPIFGTLTFAMVSAGNQHTCALTTGQVAYCWGYNSNGQLGDATKSGSETPVRVAGQ